MFRLTVALAVAAAVAAMPIAQNLRDRAYYEGKFFDWVAKHEINIESGAKFVQYLQNFANNDDYIESHNAQKKSYTLGHNKFSHLTQDEWREYVKLGLSKPEESEKADSILNASTTTNPTSLDWTTKGAVTPVKDQGQCGSCWSFSATGALEGAYYNKHGALKSFSEQNFVDCDNLIHGGRDHGCNGGLMDNAFSWAKKNGGLCEESDYTYVSGTTKEAGSCDQSKHTLVAAYAPNGYVDVQKNSAKALEDALQVGPVSIAIQADEKDFQLYKSGVFTAPCGTKLDHGVLVVGYGTQDGLGYWKVKNSWGTSWGDNGYILLARDVSQPEGQCGLYSGPPSYPTYA